MKTQIKFQQIAFHANEVFIKLNWEHNFQPTNSSLNFRTRYTPTIV